MLNGKFEQMYCRRNFGGVNPPPPPAPPPPPPSRTEAGKVTSFGTPTAGARKATGRQSTILGGVTDSYSPTANVGTKTLLGG